MIAILDKIDEAQSRLDAIDSQLSASIVTVESALRGRVKTRIEIAAEHPQFTRIAFGKHHKEWQLLVERGGEWHPLASVSRDVRAQVLGGGHLERLITEAVPNIESQIADRKAASVAASNVLALLHIQQGA